MHTPTPWHNSAVYVKSDDGIPILCTADRDEETPEGYTYKAAVVPAFDPPSDEQQDNAAFIVQACNAHDDLVAALELILSHQGIYGAVSNAWRRLPGGLEKADHIFGQARAALAKAGH